MRKYLLIYDNGKAYGEMTFYSQYRAGSKKNIEDAKSQMKVNYGRVYKVVQITLIKD